MNDNDSDEAVTIITGRVWRESEDPPLGVHVLLLAPDDDTAVQGALEALANEGYQEADLDQIGELAGVPEEEPHISAYQGALEGAVSVITFKDEG